MPSRHFVTGHDQHGRAVFVQEGEQQIDSLPSRPAWRIAKLWGADAPPHFPDDGSGTYPPKFFPPQRGFRFYVLTLPPQPGVNDPPVNRDALLRDMDRVVPGLTEVFETGSPGMHTSDTIDFGYVISGTIWLELDEGAMRELRAGDTFVQNGTRHAWRNKGLEACTMLFVHLGVERDPSALELAKIANSDA